MIRLEEFDFQLPAGLIANAPAESRDASRLLHVERGSGRLRDRGFSEITDLISPRDVLVLNNTRVFPARLIGKTEAGANVEILLEEEFSHNQWKALAKPAKRLKPGKVLIFDEYLRAVIADRTEDGRVVIEFDPSIDVWSELERVGKTPLPHYIRRDEGERPEDRESYQTVYAANRGAIAAPTAGFHFTKQILEELRVKGVTIIEITLHVGYGTFEPVRVDDLSRHSVLPERIEISEDAALQLRSARAEKRRIIAVGTTTTRALESSIDSKGVFHSVRSRTSLTVTPGYKFKAVDALLTNFHLPKSSLLILVSTFAGHELIMKAYKHAVESGYRFYSYGDCMLIQ